MTIFYCGEDLPQKCFLTFESIENHLHFDSIENHFVHPIVWKEQSGNWHEMCLSRVIVTIDHRLSKNLVGIHNVVHFFLKSNLNSQSQYRLIS